MVEIYKDDGTYYCVASGERALIQDEHELLKLGITPMESAKKHKKGMRQQLCGTPTGACNVFTISDDDWSSHYRLILRAGFLLWDEQSEDTEGDIHITSVNDSADGQENMKIQGGGGDPGPWPWGSMVFGGGGVNPWPWTTAVDADYQMALQKIAAAHATAAFRELKFFLIGKRLRVYFKGDMITQDYIPDRVNIVLDKATGVIVDVRVG